MKKMTVLFALVCCFIVSQAMAQQSRTFTRADVATAYSGPGFRPTKAAAPAPRPKAAGEVSRAYGIRVYSDDSKVQTPDIVSFDVDNPNSITVDHQLEKGKSIKAAVLIGTTYYMIESDDQMVAYRMSSYDMTTGKYSVIKEYDTYDDLESALIFQCMAYDPTTKNVYAYAFNIKESTGEGDNLDIPFELFSVDVTTGKATKIGENAFVQILALAVNPEGYLYGIGSDGQLWDISKTTGKPGEPNGNATDTPSALQSMAFDSKDGTLYWAGFSITSNDDGSQKTGRGFFSKFNFNEDEYLYEYSPIADFADNSEIIGLTIDSNPMSRTAPASVTGLKLTPGADGASEAVLSWTNPTTDIAGNELSDDLTVKVTRGDKLVKTLENQKPGASVSMTDEDVASGIASYTVVPSNASGDGKTAYIEGFVGKDVPAEVESLNAEKASDGNDITVSWQKPSKGKNGGWFDSSSLKYNITRLPDNKQMATGLTETTFTDRTITEMQGYSYVVTPTTADGEGVARESQRLFAGTPLTVPFDCDFSTASLVRLWKVFDNDNDGQTWGTSTNKIGTFMKYFPDNELNPEKKTSDWMVSAPISLEKGKTYAVKYTIWTQGSLFKSNHRVTIGREPTVEAQTTTVKTVTGAENTAMEEQTATFSVAQTGSYSIGFEAQNAVQLNISNVKVEESASTDMAVLSLQGITSPAVGQAETYTVGVRNNGNSPVSGYKIQLVDADDNVLAEKTVAEEAAPYSSLTQTISWTPSKAGAIDVRAKVVVDADANPDNDFSEALSMTVLDGGTWYHVAQSKMLDSGFAPFYFQKSYSTSQTVYDKDSIGAPKGEIKGLVYYYRATKDLEEIPVKIYMANTSLPDFTGNVAPIEKKEFALVYDGTIRVPKNQNTTSIVFDTPFAYDGGNLCIMSEQTTGQKTSGIFFKAQATGDGTKHMWVGYGDEPFDFTQTVNYYNDMASLSLFVGGGSTGISANLSDTKLSVYPNPTSGLLNISGKYDRLNIFNVEGQLVERVSDGRPAVSLDKYPKGVYLVELLSGGVKTVERVVLTK